MIISPTRLIPHDQPCWSPRAPTTNAGTQLQEPAAQDDKPSGSDVLRALCLSVVVLAGCHLVNILVALLSD